jgi:hypothetical protein
MLDVLADAVNVLHEHRVSIHGAKHNPFNEALSWVFGERPVTSPLSFDHVCDRWGWTPGICESSCGRRSQGTASRWPSEWPRDPGRPACDQG